MQRALWLAVFLTGVMICSARPDDLKEFLQKYPQIAQGVQRFESAKLEDFLGTKQLILGTHRIEDGRFVWIIGGSDKWDIVRRPRKKDVEGQGDETDCYAIKFGDRFLRYDPQGEDEKLTLSQTEDDGTVWHVELSPAKQSKGPNFTIRYSRRLLLKAVNGPRKDWVASSTFAQGRFGDALIIASPDTVDQNPKTLANPGKCPAFFFFRYSFGSPDTGKLRPAITALPSARHRTPLRSSPTCLCR